MNSLHRLLIDEFDVWFSAKAELPLRRDGLPTGVSASYGVNRFKELMLDLAFSGMLVNQDNSEGDAKSTQETLQMHQRTGQGFNKSKKAKDIIPVSDDEKYFKVPKNWIWTRIGGTGNIFNGNSINEREKLEKYTNRSDGLPFIATKDVGYGDSELNYENGILIPLDHDEFKVAHAGSVLICAEGGSAGKKIGICTRDICFGNKLFANEVWGCIAPKYIFYFYQSAKFFKEFSKRMTGIIGGISLNQFINIPIPIPPYKEQLRIASRLDELMLLIDELINASISSKITHQKLVESVLDALVGSVDNADFESTWKQISENFEVLFISAEEINSLKKCILRLAISGRLVKQVEGDDSLDSLLMSFREGVLDPSTAASKKRKIALPPLTKNEVPFQIPKSWRWVRASEICRSISSGSTPPAEYLMEDGEIPFLKVYNIRDQKIDFDYQKQFVSNDIHNAKLRRSRLYPGDVVMNIVGPPLGKVAIIPSTYEEWNCNQAIAFFGLLPPLKPEYFYFFLCEGSFLNQIELIGAAGQDNISVTKSQNIPVPLPPLEEQERIVAKINELFSICEELQSKLIKSDVVNRKFADAIVGHALA